MGSWLGKSICQHVWCPSKHRGRMYGRSCRTLDRQSALLDAVSGAAHAQAALSVLS
jgi:hypothetical protein